MREPSERLSSPHCDATKYLIFSRPESTFSSDCNLVEYAPLFAMRLALQGVMCRRNPWWLEVTPVRGRGGVPRKPKRASLLTTAYLSLGVRLGTKVICKLGHVVQRQRMKRTYGDDLSRP